MAAADTPPRPAPIETDDGDLQEALALSISMPPTPTAAKDAADLALGLALSQRPPDSPRWCDESDSDWESYDGVGAAAERQPYRG